jgi:hypothetical protein
MLRMLIVAMAGLALWQLSVFVLGTKEPWDSANYVGFYLAALGLSAVFGYFYTARAWRWGFIVIFAQLPIMLLQAEPDGLMLVGLLFLSMLALPGAIVAIIASRLRKRHLRKQMSPAKSDAS